MLFLRFLMIGFIIICIQSLNANAQRPIGRDAIMKPVNALFDGMYSSDSAMVSNTFTNNATLFTVGDKDGEPIFNEGNIPNFLKSIGGVKPGFFKEVISNEKVQVDGNFASVWCDYSFYLNGEIHHCGINLFLLLKTENGWKIRQITDTRNQNCK